MVCKVPFTRDLIAPLRNVREVWMRNVPQHLRSQSTGGAPSAHGKENISEVGREIQSRQADRCLFCVRPLTHAGRPGRTVAGMHSIRSRSDWLCAKFPGFCHSHVSCVLGCHSTLLKKEDLLGQRSQTGCPQAVPVPRWVWFGLRQI